MMTDEIKLAAALPGTLDVIRRRWSPRAFSERPVSAQELALLLEAARWAASSNNEQPWRFIIARKSDPETYQKLLESLVESNQVWARNVPLLLLTVAKRTFTSNGNPNRFALHDTGMALANLMLQATSMGISAHPMGGYDREKARANFAIPEDFELGAAVAVGYLGDTASLLPKHQQSEMAPRTRKPIEALAFSGVWGQPAVL
jgi:nitroreductase